MSVLSFFTFVSFPGDCVSVLVSRAGTWVTDCKKIVIINVKHKDTYVRPCVLQGSLYRSLTLSHLHLMVRE